MHDVQDAEQNANKSLILLQGAKISLRINQNYSKLIHVKPEWSNSKHALLQAVEVLVIWSSLLF